MQALVSAELLRLGTLRSPALLSMGALALLPALAVVPLLAAGEPAPTAAQLEEGLRGVQVLAVLLAAAFVASTIAGEFKLGTATVTFLGQPRRGRVLGTRTAVYALLGALFAAYTAAFTITAGVLVGETQGWSTELTTTDIVGLIGGAATAAALFSGAAALVGAAARNPSVASVAIVLWNVGETLLHAAGVGPYLPFGLARALLGIEHEVAPGAAAGLLALYTIMLGLAVTRWAVRRDLA